MNVNIRIVNTMKVSDIPELNINPYVSSLLNDAYDINQLNDT